MKSSSIRWTVIVWPSAVILIFVVLPLLLPHPKLKRELTPLEKDIDLVRLALWQYESEHGQYPYDERGPAYALYKLKPYLTNLPAIMPEEIWNEKEERLDTIPFGYVNEPQFTYLKAEKLLMWVPMKDGANLCVLGSGNTGYGYPGEPCGK
jgi:hypothetical protein